MRLKLAQTSFLLAIVALGTSGAGAAAPATASADLGAPPMIRAIRNLSNFVDRTVPAVPAHLPAPTMSTGIGPGAHLLINMDGGLYGCTANFIWAGGGNRYLGAAGHCFLPVGRTATHNPGADYNRLLSTVRVCVSDCIFGGETGFSIDGTTVQLGAVAYARQTQGGVDVGNDFGLVQIPTALFGQIRPSMPVWGGPTSTGSVSAGTIVCMYGNGIAVGETFPTMARVGIGTGSNTSSWSANGPFMLGDSGSAVEICGPDSGGVHGMAAVGILTHLTPVNNGMTSGTTMTKAVSMATQASLSISLVHGS